MLANPVRLARIDFMLLTWYGFLVLRVSSSSQRLWMLFSPRHGQLQRVGDWVVVVCCLPAGRATACIVQLLSICSSSLQSGAAPTVAPMRTNSGKNICELQFDLMLCTPRQIYQCCLPQHACGVTLYGLFIGTPLQHIDWDLNLAAFMCYVLFHA